MVNDFLLLSVLAAAFSTTTVLPELRSWRRFRELWSPVSAPPRQIGDDYHYFGLLRILDAQLKRLFFSDADLAPNYKLPRIALSNIMGLALNLIPYLIFSGLTNRKIAIVSVRWLNRFTLVFLAILIGKKLLPEETEAFNLLFATVAFMVAFMFSPIDRGESIIRNIRNKRHIFDRSSANEMTRAMASETSTPATLAGVYFSLLWLENPEELIWIVLILITIAIVAFTYVPAAVAFGIFNIVIAFGLGKPVTAFFTACVLGVLLFSFSKILANDHTTRGSIQLKVPMKGALKKLYRAVARNSYVWGLVGTLLSLSLFAPFDLFGKNWSFLIPIGVASPAVFRLLSGSHLGRVWVRGWEPVFTIVVSAYLMSALAHWSNPAVLVPFVSLLFLGFAGSMLYYFSRQASYLLEAEAMKLDQGKFESVQQALKSDVETIPSDDPEAALYIFLYTERACGLLHYSLQTGDYRAHLKVVVQNLKNKGWSESRVVEGLSSNLNYTDWLHKRPCTQGSVESEIALNHTLQFWATYREYNSDLSHDLMYIPGTGWTADFVLLVRLAYLEGT